MPHRALVALCVASIAVMPALAEEGHTGHGEHAEKPAMPAHARHGGTSAAEMIDAMSSPHRCAPGFYYYLAMSMCLPRPRAAGDAWVMPMVNAFFVDSGQEGPRGVHQVAAPNSVMTNAGVDVSSWSRLELDLMLTFERWTLPQRGYPLFFQIGELNEQGTPYVDAQHPHSSPLMGLTLSTVLSFDRSSTKLLRLSFAPRGASTDGPIPFMHRPTGMVNPDAPLGHHIGQDAGHISSTVFAAGLYAGGTIFELSAFYGREPEPARVDLPLGVPDSFAARLSQIFPRVLTLSASFAYVRDLDTDASRISVSAYTEHTLSSRWRAHTAFIWGGITHFEGAGFTESLAGELLFFDASNAFWGRLEALQRSAAQLEVVASRPNDLAWVGAVTLGYTRRVATVWDFDFAVGGSATLSFVPQEFHDAYGGYALFTARLFLELRGMKHWSRQAL
jgi:hypothetical protein